jgi:hypothetical protein
MSDTPRYINPRVHVIMADGAEWDAQTLNPDLLAYERTATKHRWPTADKSPMNWLTFLAWRAGLREGHIDSTVTWERFSEELAAEVGNPDAHAGRVDPTEPAPDTD